MNLQDVTFYPKVQLDFFHLEKESPNNKDIFVNNYIPTLHNDSVGLVTFDGNNDLQGISSSALGYTFSVYREKNDNDKLDFITSLSDGSLSIIDYNIANENNYKYYIFKEDSTVSSEANISNSVRTCWWNWSLTGLNRQSESDRVYYVDESDVWIFNLNIATAPTTQNFNKTTYLNLTNYPKVSTGKTNYLTGSFTCLIGDIINDKYYDTVELEQAWRDFTNNGKLKLLKDRKGNKYIVEIMDSSSKTLDETQEQASSITIGWTQVNHADDVTIIGS